MSLIIQKYGGTSVATPERIARVAERIVATTRAGHAVVVVVSAMGDTTDRLLALAHAVQANPKPRELDMLLATGEQVRIALLAMAIDGLGAPVTSFTGGMSGIITEAVHKKARISSIVPVRLEQALADGHVAIVAGFQGVNEYGDITTLGRGGSDTTAVALAVALKADYCEIYTDVPGVFTADPRIVANAYQLPHIQYDEMLELARLGASVLHPRSVELASNYSIPLFVRSSFTDQEGTCICQEAPMEKVSVRGISLDEDIARLCVARVPDRPGVAFALFSKLAEKHVGIDMILQNLNHANTNDISFTVSSDDLLEATSVCREFLDQYGHECELDVKENVAKISLVGTGITSSADVACRLFGTLYELNINIDMISTSEIKISCIIDSQSAKAAYIRLHQVFLED